MRALALAAVFLMRLTSADAFDLQGHRGARGLAPENTLEGFALALSIGVTTLELDLAMTRDNVLVVSHDRRLNPDHTRGPDGKFLDADGARIPTLAALFGEVARAGADHVRFNIETKITPTSGAETPDPEAFAAAV